MRAHRDGAGPVAFTEPAPAHCAGPDRHPMLPGRVLVSWRSCRCRAADPGPGGHRTWRCRECQAHAEYPVCAERGSNDEGSHR